MNVQLGIKRINLDVKEDGTVSLKNTILKEYMLGDTVEDDGEGIIINWYKIDDLSALEQLKLGKLDLTKKTEENKDYTDKEEIKEAEELKK